MSDALYSEAMALLKRAQEILANARDRHEIAEGQARLNAQTVMRQAHEIRKLERLLAVEKQA
jgi:exonuclease VII small subunit